MKIFEGNSGNSVLLTIVKAFTTISGILSTMIMSHALSSNCTERFPRQISS